MTPTTIHHTTKKEHAAKYLEAIGRRKEAVARIRITPGQHGFLVNGKDAEKYFPTQSLQKIINAPISRLKILEKFLIEAKVSGGGIHAQSEAVRHGISRALVIFDAELKKRLKVTGFLTRDPRAKERRKYGLRKARRAPQWAKR